MPITAGDRLRAIRDEHLAGPSDAWRSDELELMRWTDRYKKLCGRPFPTIGEVLAVILLLGYRQVGENRLATSHDPQQADDQEQFLERLIKRAGHPRFTLGRPGT